MNVYIMDVCGGGGDMRFSVGHQRGAFLRSVGLRVACVSGGVVDLA